MFEFFLLSDVPHPVTNVQVQVGFIVLSAAYNYTARQNLLLHLNLNKDSDKR